MSKDIVINHERYGSDVNDLYTDEHMIMTQADLLEQMYSNEEKCLFITGYIDLIQAMHDLARHKELVVKKREKGAECTSILDPNQFPIQKLSGEFVEEYESVWDIEKDTLSRGLERYVGHTLALKDSSIDHHGNDLNLNSDFLYRGWSRSLPFMQTLEDSLTWNFTWTFPRSYLRSSDPLACDA